MALDSPVTLRLFLVADKFTTLRLSIFICKVGLMVRASPSLVTEMMQYSEMHALGTQYVEMARVHAVASQIPPDSAGPGMVEEIQVYPEWLQEVKEEEGPLASASCHLISSSMSGQTHLEAEGERM